MYSSSLWRTDTIAVSKLNKAPFSINPPPSPHSDELEMNKPPGGLNRGFTVVNIYCIKYVWQNYTND